MVKEKIFYSPTKPKYNKNNDCADYSRDSSYLILDEYCNTHNLSHENIYKFVNTYYYPRIIDFNDYTAPIIFSKRQPSLVLFSSIKNSENNNYSDILNKIWPEIKYKIKLFLCVKRGYMASRMAEYCGITENNIPKIFIVYY